MEIRAESLYKEFGDRVVVDNLSFIARPGEVLGILGPNGAGKTTTLRILLDIIKPDSGEVTFDGQPISNSLRNVIGYLPEERGVYQKYALIDILVYFGRLKNLPQKKAHVEAVRLLDRFEMVDYIEHPVNRLSKGMQQKVQLIIALIHDPQIIIFDEPFSGLDPLNQNMVRKVLSRYKEQGRTIVLSTHNLVEAENLCDEILLIHQGRAVLTGSMQKIREKHKENLILVEGRDNLNQLRELPGVNKVIIEKHLARLYVEEKTPIPGLLEKIIKTVHINRLEVNRPSLNDIFLKIVNDQKRTGE